jgi:hypothetical protein
MDADQEKKATSRAFDAKDAKKKERARSKVYQMARFF